MDLVQWMEREIIWSKKTFGDGARTEGVLKHIEHEIEEVREIPDDLMEWIDIVILALDGAWRSGHSAEEIAAALQEKQKINFCREWDLPPAQDQPSFHKKV